MNSAAAARLLTLLPPRHIVALAQTYFALRARARAAWSSRLVLATRSVINGAQSRVAKFDLSVEAYWHVAPLAVVAVLIANAALSVHAQRTLVAEITKAGGSVEEAKHKIKIEAEKELLSASRRLIDRVAEALTHARTELQEIIRSSAVDPAEQALLNAVRVLVRVGSAMEVETEVDGAGAAASKVASAVDTAVPTESDTGAEGREQARVGQLPYEALHQAVARCGFRLKLQVLDASAALGHGVADASPALPTTLPIDAFFGDDSDDLDVDDDEESTLLSVTSPNLTTMEGRKAEHTEAALRAHCLMALFLRRRLKYATALTLAAFQKRTLQESIEEEERSGSLSPEAAKAKKAACALTLVEARHADRNTIKSLIESVVTYQNDSLGHADPMFKNSSLRRRRRVEGALDSANATSNHNRRWRPPGEAPAGEWTWDSLSYNQLARSQVYGATLRAAAAATADGDGDVHKEVRDLTDAESALLVRDCDALDSTLESAIRAYRATVVPKHKAMIRVLSEVGVPWGAVPRVIASVGLNFVSGFTKGMQIRYKSKLITGIAGLIASKARGRTSGRFNASLVQAAFAASTCTAFTSAFDQLINRLNNDASKAIQKNLVQKCIAAVFAMDLEVIDGSATSLYEVIDSLTSGYGDVLSEVINLPSSLCGQILALVLSGVELYSQSPLLLAVAFALTKVQQPILNWVTHTLLRRVCTFVEKFFGVGPRVYDLIEVLEHSSGSMDMAEALQNMTHIRSSAQEHYLLDKMMKQQLIQENYYSNDLFQNVFHFINYLGTCCVPFGLLTLGVVLITGGDSTGAVHMTAEQLFTFKDQTDRITQEWFSIQNTVLRLYNGELQAFGQFESIRAILDHRPTIGLDDERYPAPPSDPRVGLSENSVAFEDVTFNYPGKGPTLRNVTFHIPAGSFVGICGHSGAGKTTMFKLIQRFYDPSHGVIKIGGKDIREIQPLWLRKQMAVAQQEPLILSDTMRANMVWGAEEQLELLAHSATSGDEAQIAEEELLMNAIRHVGREKPFLKSPEKFAQGLDTQINMWSMSPGEKKSVGLVRAMLRDASIFMLDEPTASLDAETEGMVRREVLENRKDGRTVICIAHRLSTIRAADIILFFNANGELAESGGWDDLMEVGGGFASFVRQQDISGTSTSNSASEADEGEEETGEDGEIGASEDAGGEAADSLRSTDDVTVPLRVHLDHVAIPPALRRATSFTSAEENEHRREVAAASSPAAANARAPCSSTSDGRNAQLLELRKQLEELQQMHGVRGSASGGGTTAERQLIRTARATLDRALVAPRGGKRGGGRGVTCVRSDERERTRSSGSVERKHNEPRVGEPSRLARQHSAGW